MANFGKVVALILLLALAACATSPRKRADRAPNWESEELAAMRSAQTKPVVPPAPPSSAAPSHKVATNSPPLSWQSLDRWCEANNQPPPARIGTSSTTYSCASSNGLFIFRSGSTALLHDGLEVWLGFPPQSIDGHLFVHGLDFQKTIGPLLAAPQLPSSADHPVIVIDPGHGGTDPGTQTSPGNHFEKDLTLDWARRLAPLLATNGWQVFLTRTNDIDLALSNRVSFADAHRADLFISLHFNASSESRQQGIETYCLTPSGMPSSITRNFQDDLSAALTNNLFDAQNLALAWRVHSGLVRSSGSHDRGLRRARFPGVLRNQNRPAVLVEGGYLSNPLEAGRITSSGYRQQLAQALAVALSAPANAGHEVAKAALPVGNALKQPSAESAPPKNIAVP